MRCINGLGFVIGLVCMATTHGQTFFYTGVNDGEFLDETNWTENADGTGANPAIGSINDGGNPDISIELVINGDMVTSSGDLDIGEGGTGSLTLTGGADLDIPGTPDDFDIDSDGAFNMVNSTLTVGDRAFFGGTIDLVGGTVTVNDDLRIQASATSFSIVGTTLDVASQLWLDTGVDVAMTDVVFDVDGDFGEDDDSGDAGRLTLLGNSTFSVDDLEEGSDLVLGGSSSATLGTNSVAGYIRENSTVTLLTQDASLIVPTIADFADGDPRDSIISGLTGLTYNQTNGVGWNVTDWNGLTAETLQVVPEPTGVVLAVACLTTAALGRLGQRGAGADSGSFGLTHCRIGLPKVEIP